MNLSPPKIPGLYIHIPFCSGKCPYCNFYSIPTPSEIPKFLEGLFREMDIYRQAFRTFDTVYIGGGTPSILQPAQLRDLLNKIRQTFHLFPESEITLEANPSDLDLSYCEFLRNLGFNRINVGVQSFDPEILKFLGRRHSVEQAISAIQNCRRAGFENLGLDFIYGIPGQKLEPWLRILAQAIRFAPEHLSCYELTLEPLTPLGNHGKKGNIFLPDEEKKYEFFINTAEFLESNGYIHYEVSNFAKGWPFASRHNQKYWDHTDYLGLGPSAHSFSGGRRWWNHRSLSAYLNHLAIGKPPVEGTETLTGEELQLEALFLGLRTKKGIFLKEFFAHYQCDLLAEKKEMLARLQDEGLLQVKDGFLFPTRTGLAVADGLALI